MPGTLVSDANAANLFDGSTLNSAGSTNGTAVDLHWPREVQVRIETSAVTGTSPTLDVTIQGADDSGFSSGVVDICKFPQIGDEDDATKVIDGVFIDKQYVRAVVVVGGTSPVYTSSTCTLHDPGYQRVRTQTA